MWNSCRTSTRRHSQMPEWWRNEWWEHLLGEGERLPMGWLSKKPLKKYPFLKSPCGVCLYLFPYICVGVHIKHLILNSYDNVVTCFPFVCAVLQLFQEMGRLHDEINICRRFEDGFKFLVPKVLGLTQRKSPLAHLALEEREAALSENVPGKWLTD